MPAVPRLWLILLIAALFLSVGAVSHADVVELKNGQRVEGMLKQATPTAVTIEVGGQTIRFDVNKVRAIYFGAAPPSPAKASSTPAGTEALSALKALRSAVEGGVTFRDYQPRISDAKIKVDQYLETSQAGDADSQKAMATAIRHYVFAANAWSARIRQTELWITVSEQDALKECRKARDFMEKDQAVLARRPERRVNIR
jgi:hypothetical protein